MAIESITSVAAIAAVTSGNTIRHIAVALRTATAARRTGLAVLLEVIRYRTASEPRKETSAGKVEISGATTALVIVVDSAIEAIAVVSVIAVASVIEEALAIEAVSATVAIVAVSVTVMASVIAVVSAIEAASATVAIAAV